MLDNNGPKDGDFVKYVESLSHVPTRQDKAPDPAVIKDELVQAAPVMPPLDAVSKKNFAELIRAVALVFVTFVFIAPILPEPVNLIVRLAAIFYAIYVFRKMSPVLQGLRARLEEISKQQGKR